MTAVCLLKLTALVERRYSVVNSELQIIYTPPSWFERLDWSKVFPRSAPIEVDLGCGDGSFLVQSAKLRPEHNFLGVERLLGRIRKVEKKARRLSLTNVRGLRIENSYAVQWLFPPESVAVIHVLFPDPWPKRRHWDRRLIQREFSQHICTALERGGVLNLATDYEEYYQQMVAVCSQHEGFLRIGPFISAYIDARTDFESGFIAEGRKVFRAQFRKT